MDGSCRERFRLAGRRVLRDPADAEAHRARVLEACGLEGSEPLQGALADMVHAVGPAAGEMLRGLLRHPSINARLASGVLQALAEPADSGTPLPRVATLATRYSILTMPSLDVPARAMLCGADDSRRVAAWAIPELLAGNRAVEEEFLEHCEGSFDTLAFMLARSALVKAQRGLSQRWRDVSEVLQRGGGA